MTIIKKGTKPFLYYRICPECESIIEFQRKEVSFVGKIDCPLCGMSIHAELERGNMPSENKSEIVEAIAEYNKV